MIRMSQKRCSLLAFLCLLPCACATFAPKDRTIAELNLPDSFTLYEDKITSPAPWWTLLGSDELNELVAMAMADNLTLSQIHARVTQMRMAVAQTGAARYPAVSFSGDASATRTHRHMPEATSQDERTVQQLSALRTLIGGGSQGATTSDSALGGAIAILSDAQTRLGALESLMDSGAATRVTTTTENYALGLSASYEVDLWGRLGSAHNAALLDVSASEEDLHSAMLSLSGAVTSQWLTIVSCRQEIELVHEQIKINQTILELLEMRHRRGLSSLLDVTQQRQILAETEALLPPMESTCAVAMNALRTLLGKYPQDTLPVQEEHLPDLPDLPALGLPADLLATRPDIRNAGLALRAADWRVAAARADRLPSLRLSASAGYQADSWSLLFDNWMAMLAGSVTGPIFDAGRRKAEVMRTQAVVEERLASYRLVVITAVREVEDALIQETKQGTYIEALDHQLGIAREAHEQAMDRYRKGLNSYLPVLSALTTIQHIERAMVRARLNQALFRQQLHLALGGAWMYATTQSQEMN